MERLPAQYQPVILEARQAYLGEEDHVASRADQLKNLFTTYEGEITKVVGKIMSQFVQADAPMLKR